MKIKVTTNMEVNIDTNEQTEITKKFLRKLFKVPKGSFIKGTNLVRNVECYTSHSWVEEEVIRELTESDKLYFKFMDEFKKKNDDA